MFDVERDLLVRGMAAAKAGSGDEARFFLEKFLRLDPPMEMRVEAWRSLAEVSDRAGDKRDYIGRILAVDPTDGEARRALAVLDGRLNPSEIVNPDRATPLTPVDVAPARVERLTCPRCGSARLVAGPEGRMLVCEHCHYQEAIPRDEGMGVRNAREESDFAATIWTAKGHRTAERTVAFVCGGCGASFLLPPPVQSLSCPFCGSVHVNAEADPREVIPPTAIVPFVRTAAEALDTLHTEMKDEPSASPSAIYLPAWMFTFGGSVRWTGYEQDREGLASHLVRTSGDYAVLDQTALVSASRRLPESLQHLVDDFDLSAVSPYEARRLAGYPVVAYDVTLDEASIVGRRKALEAVRPAVREDLAETLGLEMTFSHVDIETF